MATMAIAAISTLVGCSDGDPNQITILCGDSFRDPMEKLARQFEEESGYKVALSLGGSEDHFPNVETKKAGDIFVAHTPFMQQTKDAGSLLGEAVPVGYVVPVLVVAKGNPKGVQGIEDLTREGLRVVLPNPEYAECGKMVFALLEKKGIKDAVLANVDGALQRKHSEIANAIIIGARDAGIMWNGKAHGYLDKIEIVPCPYEYDTKKEVAVMGLSYTKKKDIVEKFLDFIEKNGPAVFEEFGYVK
jgi:molybdate transport system substrate-binding protein